MYPLQPFLKYIGIIIKPAKQANNTNTIHSKESNNAVIKPSFYRRTI